MESILSFHDTIKKEIFSICNKLGYRAIEECRGNGWRADILVMHDDRKIAFEVQITRQTLKRTLERQAKFVADNVIGCWLFEKEPAKQQQELESLPSFKLENVENTIYVSLKNRKSIPLEDFIRDFVQGNIKFCENLNILPKVNIEFIEMECYKCGEVNHIFYIAPFITPCNTKITYDECKMWESDKLIFRPEILNKITEYSKTDKGKYLNLSKIKNRYSNTVGDSYMSFGCNKCDSLFGDFYISRAIFEAQCGINKIVDKISLDVEIEDIDLSRPIPHWCHSGNDVFCE